MGDGKEDGIQVLIYWIIRTVWVLFPIDFCRSGSYLEALERGTGIVTQKRYTKILTVVSLVVRAVGDLAGLLIS